MKMIGRSQRAVALLAIVAVVAGCTGAVTAPTVTQVPTFRSAAPATAAPATAAPSVAATPTRNYNFDFANWTENSPYAHSITATLQDKILPLTPYVKMKFYNNEGDAQVMLRNIDLVIADKPDYFLFYCPAGCEGAGDKLKAANQLCVAINVFVPNCTYFNLSNQGIGTDTAKVVGEIAAAKGWSAADTTVLIVNNAAAPPEINNCVTYFYSTIAPMLGMPEVDPTTIKADTTNVSANGIQVDGKSQTEPSFNAVLNILPNIKTKNVILYTVNNDSTIGALRALEQGGRTLDTILIGGLGGDAQGISNLRTNPSWVAEGDIFYSWWGLYFTAMGIALLNGATPPQITASPQLILTKDNVDTYHVPGSDTELKALPPLVPDNQYLAENPASLAFLQDVGVIEGLPTR